MAPRIAFGRPLPIRAPARIGVNGGMAPSTREHAAAMGRRRPPDEFQALASSIERRSELATRRCHGGVRRGTVYLRFSEKPDSRGLFLQLVVADVGQKDHRIRM
jgi:hypothetical protein